MTDTSPANDTHAVLAHAIEKGRDEMPKNPEPLVCKPKDVPSWRIYKIMTEFVKGFSLLRRYGLAITFFGSARFTPENPYYQASRELAGRLAKRGFAVMTGGSGGIMAGANQGAHDAGGASIGLNIRLPNEQQDNAYLTDSLTFDHFFVRKVMMTFSSEIYIYFPGGFGTLDEFFEIVTLVQTRKIKKIPIVVFGKDYWGDLDVFIRNTLLKKYNVIDQEDLNLYRIVDSVDEAYEYITSTVTC